MQQLPHKSAPGHQSRVFRSSLAFEIFAFSGDRPRGNYTSLGKTPGKVEVPAGYDLVALPLELTLESLPLYTKDITSLEIKAIYLSGVRDSKLLNEFCKSNQHIRHIVLESCGWSLTPIEELIELEVLEIRSNVQVAKLACIEKLPSLKGLIITSSNNVFSSYIPKSESLEELVLFNIACLVRLEELIQCINDNFPALKVLHLNNCGSSESCGEVEISHLKNLNLCEFQAIGTRVVDSIGIFRAYCQERKEVSGYLDSLKEGSPEATLNWKFTHNDDLKELCEKAPGIKSISLVGSRDISDLSFLSGFTDLESLSILNCENIHTLEPVVILKSLKNLSVKNCPNIADYCCLFKCRILEALEISGGGNGVLTPEVYREQLAYLYLNLPRNCSSWECDISNHDLIVLLEGDHQFIEDVKQELLCNMHCPCEDRRCEHAR